MYLSKKAKIIIGVVVGVLVVAGVIGGSIAIANAVKKDKQAKCEHVYDEGQITAEATCEEPGMIVYTCGECKYEFTEEIPANGHVETIIAAVPATCTAKGLTDGVKCVTCEEVLVAPVETPMLGHKVTALKAVAATCTTAGKTEGSVCSRCDEVLKEQTVIPANGHTVVEVKGVEPTCTEAGKTSGSMCSACGIVYSAQEDIAALGHSDANGDGVCDVCKEIVSDAAFLTLFADESNYTEVDAQVGDLVAGKVYRIYRPDEPSITSLPGYGYYMQLSNFVSSDSNMGLQSMPKGAEDYEENIIFKAATNGYAASGIYYKVYDDYVDFYLLEGTYQVESLGIEVTINEQTAITFCSNTQIKQLVLN